LKRRQKAEQKEKEKLEKAQNAVVAKEKTTTTKTDRINEEEISPNEYFKLRSAAVAELKRSPASDPYPHKFHVSTSLVDFIEQYSNLNDGQTLDSVKLR